MMYDKDVLKALNSVLDMLRVRPLEDGNYLVEVTYKNETPRPYERQYIAAEIAELLHRRIGHLRSGVRWQKKHGLPSTVSGNRNE